MQRSKYDLHICLISILLITGGCKKETEEKADIPTHQIDPVKTKQVVTNTAKPKSRLLQELEFAAGTNLLAIDYKAKSPSTRKLYEHQSLADALVSMIDPASLEKYEGSYTADDLKNSEDDSASYTLKSSWVTGRDAPSVGIYLERNPATGNYEISGGELFLPKTGVGMSFEENQTTGESQTFLNWKRDF